MRRFEGRTVIVTGAGSGLGRATSVRLADEGAAVGCLDLVESACQETVGSITEKGGSARAYRVDVADPASVRAAVDGAAKDLSRPSVLINCAGIGSALKTVGKDGKAFSLDVFRRTLEVNLVGTFNCIRLTAAKMVGNEPDEGGERGVIVNTSSVAAFEGQMGQAAYSASKGCVVSMTLPIARDLSRNGNRVCTIAPGLFDTPLLKGLPEDAREALGRSIPFPPRLGRPPEYALLACHILENAMLNGEVIRLDGAIRMQPR